MARLLGTLGLLVWAAACVQPSIEPRDARPDVRRVPVIGWFHDYDELLRGTAMGAGLGDRSFFVLEGSETGMRCVGRSELVELPIVADPLRECAGRLSDAFFRCSDGRDAKLSFRATDCARGIAQGVDRAGNRMTFIVGYAEDELGQRARDELARASDRPSLPRFDPQALRQAEGFSTGTAFFVSSEGHLITNYHVVEGARSIEVVLPGGESFSAGYLDRDLESDLALLQVEGIQSAPLAIADPAGITKAQEVFALGFPLVNIQGQEPKATFGRINALSGMEGNADFLQIDVPIQPGNSGGPLVSPTGEVVGVVTATLDQAVAMRLAGVVPQNVNYALKASVLARFLATARIGSPSVTPPSEPLALEEQVARTERSVALVICR